MGGGGQTGRLIVQAQNGEKPCLRSRLCSVQPLPAGQKAGFIWASFVLNKSKTWWLHGVTAEQQREERKA